MLIRGLIRFYYSTGGLMDRTRLRAPALKTESYQPSARFQTGFPAEPLTNRDNRWDYSHSSL
jgi:hypothetical protein